jgi:conjugative relaxase-like TrwC/TraI family protein
MLNVAWMQGSAADVTRYFAEADYYIDNNGGLWGGRDSASLGFKGEVDREHLKAMLNNRDASGQKITARDHATRRRGLEMTFSAPKSLSVMDAFGDTRIRSAFQKAVAITMNEVEQRAQRRVRDKGQDANKTTGSLVYASFNHSLGRPVNGVPDMQMHSHVLIGNMTRDRETGKWYALEAGDIMKDAPYYQAFFRQTLAEQIQSLGYQLKVSKGDFEIKGVDKSILTKFSNRSKEVEAAATTIQPSYDPEAGEYVVVEGAKSAQEVDAILNTRASNYGSFLGLSQVTQRLKAVAHQFAGQNNKTFDADQAEALDLIFTKVGRILNGDPNYVDSWTDIAGYATLVADRLQGKIR